MTEECPRCDGKGLIEYKVLDFPEWKTCLDCNGTGEDKK
jgi:DnaJ-class molecular chaperone